MKCTPFLKVQIYGKFKLDKYIIPRRLNKVVHLYDFRFHLAYPGMSSILALRREVVFSGHKATEWTSQYAMSPGNPLDFSPSILDFSIKPDASSYCQTSV